MKYNEINALDTRIENTVKKTVHHYYTDWKNYDRPKYMKCKGSDDLEEKEIILIARECGTYLITKKDIKKAKFAATIIEYYFMQEYSGSHYYRIDLNALTINKMKDDEIKSLINANNRYWHEIEKAA